MKRTLLAALAVTFLLSVSSAFGQAPPPGAKEETLTHEQIKSTVDSHLGDVKACMKEKGASTGKLIVRFGVMPNGHPIDLKAHEQSSNKALDGCIVAAMGKWTFPKRVAGPIQGIDYPFIFAPPKADLTDDQIVTTVKGHVGDVKSCYEDGLKEKSDLKGKMVIEFTVGEDGKVVSTKTKESTINHAKVETCILTKAKTWVFPKPKGVGNVVFPYPFDLTPAAPAKKE